MRPARQGLLAVPSSCSGKAVHAMLLQMLHCIGAHSWRSPEITNFEVGWPDCFDTLDGSSVTSCHLCVTIIHADRGPDQVARVPIAEREVAWSPYACVVARWRKQHSQHLIVKAHWRVLERFGYRNYFGAVAKLVHLMRSSGNLAKLRQKWESWEGTGVQCKRLYKTLPPIPLRGRGVSIHHTEAWLRNADE